MCMALASGGCCSDLYRFNVDYLTFPHKIALNHLSKITSREQGMVGLGNMLGFS